MENHTATKSWDKRRMLKVASIVLGVVLFIMLAFTIYVEYLLNQMNYVDSDAVRERLSQEEIDAILNATDGTGDTYAEVESLAPEDFFLESYDGVGIGTEAHIVNILLIGADYQKSNTGRSDSTILLTFNTRTNTLTMTSFMRDLYVKIPGYLNNKLNAAYSLGGMNLIKETLNENYGIYVDGIVEVDFSQFRRIIDMLGGVEIELTEKEANWINKKMKGESSLTAGVQLLNGREALWYSRNRNDALGDFVRTGRQRNLLNTLIETYKSASLTTIVGMMDDILPMITTDMTKDEIANYVTVLFPLLLDSEIVSQRVPADGTYHLTTINSMSVIVADQESNIQYLKDTLLGTTEETTPATE